jgi:hypothetical protein
MDERRELFEKRRDLTARIAAGLENPTASVARPT